MKTHLLSLLITASVVLAQTQCPTLPSPLPSATGLPSVTTVPNPWQFFNGAAVNSTADWTCRRNELMTLVQEYMWGYYPDHSQEIVTATRSGNSINITVQAGTKRTSFSASLSFPSTTTNGTIPVLVSPGLIVNTPFLNAGLAIATFDTSTIAADSNSKTGAFWDLYSGQDIGVLLAWAWGFHRVIDALQLVVPEVDLNRIAVIGCSRWGKAALTAGIFDSRVTLTIPMSSGVYGTAPFRENFEQDGWNEKLESNFEGAPWWSTSRIGQFVDDNNLLPFEAATFVALVAPRAIVFDQGETDFQMNPQGVATVTFPAARAVYSWLGADSQIGLALRAGGHCDPSGYTNVIDFVQKTFFNANISRDYTDTGSYPPDPQAFPWSTSPPGQ